MKQQSQIKTTRRKASLVYGCFVSVLAVCSAGVSTFAWFQAESSVRINTTSSEANITVQAPESVKFYYFKGNGVPGSANYTGYSKTGAAFGNLTNIVNTGVTPATYSTNAGGTYSSSSDFANAWGLIDLASPSTDEGDPSPKNCFNFGKMRPGCYYSFCIDTNLASTKVKASFEWATAGSKGITGADLSPSNLRYQYNTTNPLNVLMAINAYSYATNNATNSSTFIKEGLGVGTSLSLSDKIAFTPVGTGTTSADYYLLGNAESGVTTSTNHYIFFTIFMGNNNDYFAYHETTASTDYYDIGQTSGTYSPLDGLKSTLSSIEVS